MTFRTLAGSAEGLYRSRGSKFLAYASRLDDEVELAAVIDGLRGQHPKARHWCYAYRIGVSGDRYRANDDGEPTNSAGRPILGQIDAAGVTNVLVVVVRYFGGTKLGVPGLIEAYKTAAAEALSTGEIVEAVIEKRVRIQTDYTRLADLMQAIKVAPWRIAAQTLADEVDITVAAPADAFDEAYTRLWLVLAKAYPGQEQLDRSPEGYRLVLLD